jgi:hypothetical protein
MKNCLYKWKRHNIFTTFLSICLWFFATAAVAEDIVMICNLHQDGETHTRYHKYSDPIIGWKQIYQRIDGSWLEWCRGDEPDYHAPCELTITNLGATMMTVHQVTATKDLPENLIKKDDIIFVTRKYILDFEFVTRRMELYWTDIHNRYFTNGPTIEKPYTENWSCKLG